MKAHIITAAVLLLLGVVVAVFLASVKAKAEHKALVNAKKGFKASLLNMIAKAAKDGCNKSYAEISFNSPFAYSFVVNESGVCIDGECESIACNGSFRGIISKGENRFVFKGNNGTLVVER